MGKFDVLTMVSSVKALLLAVRNGNSFCQCQNRMGDSNTSVVLVRVIASADDSLSCISRALQASFDQGSTVRYLISKSTDSLHKEEIYSGAAREGNGASSTCRKESWPAEFF